MRVRPLRAAFGHTSFVLHDVRQRDNFCRRQRSGFVHLRVLLLCKVLLMVKNSVTAAIVKRRAIVFLFLYQRSTRRESGEGFFLQILKKAVPLGRSFRIFVSVRNFV